MGSNKQVFSFSKTVGRIGQEIRNTSKSGRESRESRNVSNGVEQTNNNFSKIVGRVSQENRNISRRGQTNNFFKHVFRFRKSKSRNVSFGVEQTSFQFFKKCRSSKSKNSKHIEVWSRKSRKSKCIKRGRTKKFSIFSKIVGRVSQENRNISRRGQTNNFFKHFFRSRKSKSRNVLKGVEQTSFHFFLVF